MRPQAINNFCREMGVTRADNIIHLHKLEHHVRACHCCLVPIGWPYLVQRPSRGHGCMVAPAVVASACVAPSHLS